MELPKSGIALAIICMVCGSAESCGQGRRAVYCKNRQHVDYPAFLCAGVKPTHCPQYAIKCACPKNLYRRSDGNCVQEKDCATTTDGQGEVDETARPPFKMPETFVKSDLSTRSRSFVRRPEILEIVMAAFDSWTDSECVCIKSKFLETTENGSRRSFGCYKYAIVLGAPPALEHTIGTKAIIMVTEDIDIDVEYKGGYTTMTLVPAAQPSDVQDSYDPEFDLLGKYWILAVDDDCLLVAFASDTNAYTCSTFGTNDTKVNASLSTMLAKGK
ncbi:uncharacterized protein LOC142591029 isoform X2 [Dermacentor variabilis]|uniref:uncharacterized protein LOC142591029 isoform X2 n=1 Tax=Dermacentor variabilis TaxID=34621 RepID=UPI003F5BF51E